MTIALTAHIRRVFFVTLSLILAIFATALLTELVSFAFLFVMVFAAPLLAVLASVGYLIMTGKGFALAKSPELDRKNKILAAAASPISFCILVVVTLPSLWFGAWVGDLNNLARNFATYELIIANGGQGIAANQPHRGHTFNGVKYLIDAGPPVRIAFEPEGLLDNWSGVIYDPTGDVMLAKGFDRSGKFAAPDRVTKLFGGDLVSCTHFFGHYYRCGFT